MPPNGPEFSRLRLAQCGQLEPKL